MSVKVMGRVWDWELPHAEKFILVALADHADHDGGSIRPGVPTIAKKTGYNERTVRRIIQSLASLGCLVVVEEREGKPTIYRVPNDWQPLSECHPCQNVTPDIDDTETVVDVRGTPDIYDSFGVVNVRGDILTGVTF